MPKIVQAWSVTVYNAAQADPPRDGIERPMNLPVVQPIAPAGDEQVRGYGSTCPMALASDEILREHLARRSMQGNQPILSELGTTNREHLRFQIEVLKLEIARLPQAQTRDGEQPE